jgi:hypothetical protein
MSTCGPGWIAGSPAPCTDDDELAGATDETFVRGEYLTLNLILASSTGAGSHVDPNRIARSPSIHRHSCGTANCVPTVSPYIHRSDHPLYIGSRHRLWLTRGAGLSTKRLMNRGYRNDPPLNTSSVALATPRRDQPRPADFHQRLSDTKVSLIPSSNGSGIARVVTSGSREEDRP